MSIEQLHAEFFVDFSITKIFATLDQLKALVSEHPNFKLKPSELSLHID